MRHKMPIVFLVSAFLSAFLAPHAEAVPTVPATGLEVQITESGKISLSADGAGSNAVDGITIQVNKPNAAATVRSAFFACASLGGRVINDGDVSLDGNPITWAASVQNNAGGDLTFFTNVFANVTAIVKPRVDAAVPGLVDFTQTEVNTDGIDGCALHVVFDDPSQTTDNTVFILFGGQNTDGDNFAVTLAQPLSGSDRAEMGLGISFSLQPSAMFSQIDVNAVRLTTSAGGQDDGADPNGALLTVGGIDDSTANPADPNAPPAGDPRIDDELYDLRPFVGPSDTDIFVQTLNPTDDDNIFAGHIFVTKPAIVGEGIVLTQSSSISPVGTPHTVTALVVNDLGQAVSGRVVDFQVISGPNAGTSNSGTTNANGEASFTYTGTSSAGTDVIVARFIDSTGNRQTSNKLQKTWVMRGEGIVLTQSSSISPVGTPHTVTALVVNDLSQAVSGRVVDFQVISGPNTGTSKSGTTNVSGEASFTYTGTSSAGTDVIVASFIDSTGNRQTSNELQKTWVMGGGGIVLTQPSSISPVGTPHTVTALVVNGLGQAVSGRVVDFQVISGPNAGTSNSGTTNVSGEASFTYTGTSSAGTDVIVARFIDSTGNRQTSNELQKTWFIRGEGIGLTQSSSISPVGTPHTVTALVVNDLSQAVSGRVVDFQVISGPNAGTSNSGTTNANGEASFTYTGTGSVGTDAIVARFIDSTGNPRRSNEVQKMWVLDVPNPRGGAPLSCRGATCSIPLTCPLSPALGISCINEARVLVARRFLPRRSARSSTDTAAKARRRMIVFASGIANIPPAATQDVPLRRTRTGKQIARSGRRKLVGVIEIRSSAGTSISSTPITIRIRRR